MNHNKLQAKEFNPKKHTKRTFNHAGYCYVVSGFVLAFIVAGSLMGWFEGAQAQLVLTELPATGK